MIKTEIKKWKDGRIIGRQSCSVECDSCTKIFDRKWRDIKNSRQLYLNDLCASCIRKQLYASGHLISTIGNYNISNTGKTLIEIYGKEKAAKINLSRSISRKGKPQPSSKGKFVEWNKSHKGFTNIEFYGKEKAAKISKKLSLKCSGENNPMYGKPAPIGSGNGWSGWYKEFYFRSLLELSCLKNLLDNGHQVETAETKKHAIDYFIDGNIKTYFADFYLKDSNTYIEVKPFKLTSLPINLIKFEAASKKHGENFKIFTEKSFPILSKDDLLKMIEAKTLKFTDKYQLKFDKF